MIDTSIAFAPALEQLLAQLASEYDISISRDPRGMVREIRISMPGPDDADLDADSRADEGATQLYGSRSLQEATPARGQRAEPVRAQLREIVHSRKQPVVTVTLSLHGRRVVGIGRAQSSAPEPLELLAGRATVQAMNRLVGPEAQCHVEHVQCVSLGPQLVCLALIGVTTSAGVQSAIGVSSVRNDVAEAAARAVLNATNRHLARLPAVPA